VLFINDWLLIVNLRSIKALRRLVGSTSSVCNPSGADENQRDCNNLAMSRNWRPSGAKGHNSYGGPRIFP
jgi:hypothetical protein